MTLAHIYVYYNNRAMSDLTTLELQYACKKVGIIIGATDGRVNVTDVLTIC